MNLTLTRAELKTFIEAMDEAETDQITLSIDRGQLRFNFKMEDK